MNALCHNTPNSHTSNPPQTALRQLCLITDGNSHRADLYSNTIAFAHQDLICEAMLPNIRTTALLIAAMRHDLNQSSPTVFSDESDWFAARILLLKARVIQLDISLKPMLDTANQRAQAFAQKHHIAFSAAKIRPSLHANRPANMLLMECELNGKPDACFIANTRQLRQENVNML